MRWRLERLRSFYRRFRRRRHLGTKLHPADFFAADKIDDVTGTSGGVLEGNKDAINNAATNIPCKIKENNSHLGNRSSDLPTEKDLSR